MFEYERYVPLRGWSPNNLLAVDPSRYSRSRSGAHSTNSFPAVALPMVRSALTGSGVERPDLSSLFISPAHIHIPAITAPKSLVGTSKGPHS